MAKETILRGKACVFGDYVDVYQILPQQYWASVRKSLDKLIAKELGKHAMEGADTNFAPKALAGEYAFIVAGRNFGGGGKSIEDPVFAIKGAGVRAVIAESCSRYFFRNAINNGLVAMICGGITANVKTGDELTITLSEGEILNVTTGLRLQSAPMHEISLEILNMGGYIPYIRKTWSAV